MKDSDCVQFLQWLLPQLQMRWPGFRKVRRQVCKRVDRRMTVLGLSSREAYQNWIESHPVELTLLDEFCRITISRFYRDRSVFDCLRDQILPRLASEALASGRSRLLCWSAGCASGEEPYTINIIWKQAVAPLMPGAELSIIATDSNAHMLQRAQLGCYGQGSLKDFPGRWLTSCFAAEDELHCVRPEFRLGIEWLEQDVRVAMPDATFDIIFCRHLAFTYFDENLQRQLLDRLLSKLRPGGFLITGKQESFPQRDELVEFGERLGVYRSAP